MDTSSIAASQVVASQDVLPERCATCGDAREETDPGRRACPFRAEPACPVLDDLPSLLDASLQDTVAFAPEPAAPPHDDDEPDELISSTLGQYLILQPIGRGTMGKVFRACHLGLGRIGALKVLHPELVLRQPRVVDWFRGEARAVAGLVHPHIVTIHNLGSDRGYHYVEMELIPEGVSLKEALASDGAFDPLRAASLTRQIASALAVAHGAGLIHRDVKPANVLLTAQGHAKLADFGLVRRLTGPDGGGGAIAGTPTFMAPELFRGAPASARTDLYALGITLYYLLTARLPFSADTLGHLIQQHRKAPIPDPRTLAPGVPDELAGLVNRLLAKDPAQRPASAEALDAELGAILGHLRDTEALVREALEDLDCLIQQGGREQFRVIVPVPGDRLQEVYIEIVEGRRHARVLSVFSVCAPADARHFEFALRLNAELTYGGLSIRDVGGAPMFVMARGFPRGQVGPAEIRAAVVEIARRGDWVEQQLTDSDLY